MPSFRYILTKVSQYSVLLPIITGIVYYKRLNTPFRILFYFFVFSLIVEKISSNTMKVYGSHNNMPVGHLFFFVEFLVFSAFYFLHFEKNKVVRNLIGFNMILGTIAALADACCINSIRNWPGISSAYCAVSVVVYSLAYFYFLFRDQTQYNRINQMFWVTSGALLYFANSIYYFMLKGYFINHEPQTSSAGWYINSLLNIIAYVLYARSFRCFRKQNPIQ